MKLTEIDDSIAAAAFRRLARHLQHRTDAQNIDLMGLAGFCRNCLADWMVEASDGTIDRDTARHAIYDMPHDDWKARYALPFTDEQMTRMNESLAKNRADEALDEALEESFPASDPPAMTDPAR